MQHTHSFLNFFREMKTVNLNVQIQIGMTRIAAMPSWMLVLLNFYQILQRMFAVVMILVRNPQLYKRFVLKIYQLIKIPMQLEDFINLKHI